MKKYSVWLENSRDEKEPVLKKDITCDVLIVGAGMTGLSTAYHLRDCGLHVVVVDKNKVGEGISARTTGKITYLQETIYSDLKSLYSKEVSKQYLNSQLEAIKLITEIIDKHHIECNLEKVSSYVFSNQKSVQEKIKNEKKLLQEFGLSVKEFYEEDKLVIGVEDTYVFHPVKYMLSLKELCKKDGIQFFESTDINFLEKKEDYFVCGNELTKIKAKKVVFACHYPYFLFPFLMPLKCTIEKSYIAASLIESTKPYSAISASKPVVSIRYHSDGEKKFLLYLSDSHMLSEKQDFKEHFDHVVQDVKKLGLTPKYIWSNHDIMTFDKMPFIGRLEKGSPHLFLSTGYNTWGMTNSNLAGKIIADMISDIYNPYQDLFSPLRKFNVLSLPNQMYSSFKPMVETKMWKNKKWYPDHVYFERKNGQNLAIYVDKLGKEHIVYNTCPHLKCSLLFNSVEKTWDCPCHGSRFDLDGKVIIGPSNYNITYRKR